MGLRITNNIASLRAQHVLEDNTESMARRSRRLASGLRIESAADDAAGLGIAERLRAKVASLEQARRNANDGISLLRTAEGALQEASDMVHRLVELAMRTNNETVSVDDKKIIETEFDSIVDEINRLSQATRFGDTKVFGGPGHAIELQVGAGITPADLISVPLPGFSTGFTYETLTTPPPAGGGKGDGDDPPANPMIVTMQPIEDLRDDLVGLRSTLGAVENRLTHAVDLLGRASSLTESALSRTRDLDLAAATSSQVRDRILVDAGTAVLAQANVQPRIALELLR